MEMRGVGRRGGPPTNASTRTVAFVDSHGREDHHQRVEDQLHTEHKWHQSEEALAVAIHGFIASEDDELSICKGEELVVLHRYRDAWCVAQNERSEIGLVPLNHLKVEEEEEEQPPHAVQRQQVLVTPDSRGQGGGSAGQVDMAQSATSTTGANDITVSSAQHNGDSGLVPTETPERLVLQKQMAEYLSNVAALTRKSPVEHSSVPLFTPSTGGSPEEPANRAAAAEKQELTEIFKKLDRNNDGRISHAEFIVGLKRNPSIAEALGLPARIQQEDGTRDAYQLFFGKIDTDDSKSLEFGEICRFYGLQDGSVGQRQPAASQNEHNASSPDLTQQLLPKSTRQAGEAENAAETEPKQEWLATAQQSSAVHVAHPPSEPFATRRAEEAMLPKIPDPTRPDLKADLVGPPLWSLCSGFLPVLREVDTAAADLSHEREKDKARPPPLGGRYLSKDEKEEMDQYIKALNEESDRRGGGYSRPSSPAQSPHHSPLSPNVHARRAKREILKRIINQWTKRSMVQCFEMWRLVLCMRSELEGPVFSSSDPKMLATETVEHQHHRKPSEPPSVFSSISAAETDITECDGGSVDDSKDGCDGMATESLSSNRGLDKALAVQSLELKNMDPVIAGIVPDLDDGE